jgi:hypothetical protein
MAQLIEELRKLPGIGAKSAQRLAFHILRSPAADAEALAVAVRELKAKLRLCSTCNNITDVDPCVYCASRRISAASKRRAATTAFITCSMGLCRRCTESGRSTFAREICCRA